MTLTATTHVNFTGQAAQALQYWGEVLGGEVVVVPYGAFAEDPSQADEIIWGQVSTPGGLRVMAYDVQRSLPHDAGANPFYLSLESTDADEIRAVWDAFTDGSQVHVPLGPSAFSPLYGKLTDRFGVVWVISVVAG